MSTRRVADRKALFLAVGSALLLALLAGCDRANVTAPSSTQGSSPSGSATSPGPATTPSDSSFPLPASEATSSASTGGATGTRCRPSALQPAITKTDGAAGSAYLTINLRNAGTATCTLRGYPGVSIVGHGNGTQVGTAAQRDSTAASVLVTLAPGASTSFVLRIVQAGSYPAVDCSPVPADGLRIYPPGSTEALFLTDARLTGCAKPSVNLLTVRPVGVAAG